ncbi:MAG: DUF882 domain-containing protein [Devosia sp.]|nr:DUF882 domain-containing protein [Devosia sp.]
MAATERALYLYYTHTKETSRIVFKRNGQYVQSGLNELNRFLRDWRRNEPADMDPRLFDLVWEVYQEVGGSQPINVVSAYRSPATNAMLRETSSGVAENSQHTKGHAMDFFIPGVSLTKLRAVAMRKQVGGVGFYPNSGSPFVHLDTGSVRAWPRMTRAQLKEIFPDGKTMHLPTDGKPLSQEGYQLAMAEWKRCHSVPCGDSSSGTRVASNGGGGGGGTTLMDMLFGGKPQQPAATPAPAPVQVASTPVQAAVSAQAALSVASPLAAPRPAVRPASLFTAALAPSTPVQPVATASTDPAYMPFSTVGSAPLEAAEVQTPPFAPTPVMKSEALRVATASTLPAGDAVSALAALTEPPVPRPRVLMTNPPIEDTLTAYLPTAPAMPEAQQQPLQTIAARASLPGSPILPPAPAARLPIMLPAVGADTIETASIGGPAQPDLSGLFDQTFTAASAAQTEALAAALKNHVEPRAATVEMRKPDLVAPDLEHVADIFMAPASLTSNHFAVIFDHDEADFDPTPEMGRFVTVMGVGDIAAPMNHKGFATATAQN